MTRSAGTRFLMKIWVGMNIDVAPASPGRMALAAHSRLEDQIVAEVLAICNPIFRVFSFELRRSRKCPRVPGDGGVWRAVPDPAFPGTTMLR